MSFRTKFPVTLTLSHEALADPNCAFKALADGRYLVDVNEELWIRIEVTEREIVYTKHAIPKPENII